MNGVLALALGWGCGAEEPPRVSAPVEATVAPEAPSARGLSGQWAEPAAAVADPVPADALVAMAPALGEGPGREIALGALNLVAAPCVPCLGRSIARCAADLPAAGCEPIPGLVRRAARVAAAGAPPAEVIGSVSYGDVWLPFAHLPAPADTRVRVEAWVDPEGAFAAEVGRIARAVGGSPVHVSFRLAGGSATPLRAGLVAADAQDRGADFLLALPTSRGERAEAGLSLRVASSLGLDLARFSADAEAAGPRIAADADLARTLGLRSAPSWFVEGYRLRGAQSETEIRRVIGLELTPAFQGGETSGFHPGPPFQPATTSGSPEANLEFARHAGTSGGSSAGEAP